MAIEKAPLPPVRLSCAFFADGAMMVHGKITAVGMFSAIQAAEFPARHGEMVLVFEIEGDPGAYTWGVQMRNTDGEAMFPAVPVAPALTIGKSRMTQILYGIQGWSIPKPGFYTAEIIVNDRVIGSRDLYVAGPEVIPQHEQELP